MIFKRSIEKIEIDPMYKEIAEKFSFSVVNELVYEESKKSFISLQDRFQDGKRLYPDLIAAIYRKMYENGLTKRRTLSDALLSCSHFLQDKNFEFLGFIRKDDEIDKEDGEPDFFTEWDFKRNYYKIKAGSDLDSKEPLESIFDKELFDKSYNVFFVAGSQSIEMLDQRIKKASILISALSKANLVIPQEAKIILSGRNNAKVASSKVQFANESLIMRNLLIHKLSHYLKTNLDDNFINKQIETEVLSRDTKENIQELIKKLEKIVSTASEMSKIQLNLFIVSSSFHLLQLSDHLITQEGLLVKKLKEKSIRPNVFLVGAENPNHFLRIYDKGYVKLLMNEVIHRHFKFCR